MELQNENGIGVRIDVEVVTEQEDYPEGGREAWLVVVGAWCAMIPSMGLLNTIGVIQAWLSEHQLKDYSESSVSWIIGTYAFFLYLCGVQFGKASSMKSFQLDHC